MKHIHVPLAGSHKGQNGRLLLIGGSRLFHAASIWSLTVASRIVDLVHYASVPENNELIKEAKKEFRNGIVIERKDIENYIEEDDCILIGPGMVRNEQINNLQLTINHIDELENIQDEGVQTVILTNYLLKKYPNKQWVIDAGALQMMDVSLIPKNAILTPHHGEFNGLWQKCQMLNDKCQIENEIEKVKFFANTHQCIVLLKGEKDIVSNGVETQVIDGGNAGMTKGGTGDVLAGLIAALVCTNDPFAAAIAGSTINKKAGDELYKSVGPYFNATDLANQIPKTMKEFIGF